MIINQQTKYARKTRSIHSNSSASPPQLTMFTILTFAFRSLDLLLYWIFYISLIAVSVFVLCCFLYAVLQYFIEVSS